MKLFIFATHDEAAASLERFNVKSIEKGLYTFPYGLIAISGIGSYAAQMTVAKYSEHVEEIVNMGFAASLHDDPIGKVVACSQVGKYIPLPETLDPISLSFMQLAIPQKQISSEGRRLISSDFPIHSETQRKALADWDLVDMEGYGIAFASSYIQKKCTLIKVISDFAKENGRTYIEKHKKELSKILSEHIL